MSGHFTGQSRALPFTGLTSALLVVIGLISSALGLVVTQLRGAGEA